MKKLLLFLTVASLIGSSCSSKLGIAKRKYGKGYYVSVSHKPKASNQSQAKEIVAVSALKEKSEPVNTVRVLPTLASSETTQKTTLTEPHSVKNKNIAASFPQANLTASAAKSDKNITVSELKSVKKLPLNLTAKSKSTAEDSLTLVLYIILCLFPFINLIPVYLHQGKKITNDFWITLILDIFLIFGVIYSILVVLDVLSFA